MPRSPKRSLQVSRLNFCTDLISPVHSTYLVYLIFLDLTALIISREDVNLRIPSLCLFSILLSRSLLESNILKQPGLQRTFSFKGRSATEATRLRLDEEKSRLLVEPSVRNGASPTSAATMR
jgi:hypothetical protein